MKRPWWLQATMPRADRETLWASRVDRMFRGRPPAPAPDRPAQLLDRDRDGAIAAAADALVGVFAWHAQRHAVAEPAVNAAFKYLASQPYPTTFGPGGRDR